MPRRKDPFSIRNQTEKFTVQEVLKALEKRGHRVDLAASKRARIIRDKGEFDVNRLRAIVRPPITPPAAYSWSIADIVNARDHQMAGRFRLPARLAESFGTDDALFTARKVRLSPIQSLDVKLVAGRGPKADKIADEADALFGRTGVAVSHETLRTVRSHLADHGVAFAAISWNVRADGSRVDVVLNAWPIEWVWWHEMANCYVTQIQRFEHEVDPTAGNLFHPSQSVGGSTIEPILHGNGRWVVFSKSEILPHRLDAALLPASLVWARHAFANRDWAKGSAAHGNAKVVGELPEGTALSDEEGGLTAEAGAFLQLLSDVASQDSPVGIRPAGSKIDYLTNSSRAWEVWAQLVSGAERAAARIYLGNDGILGAQGGAPGVDIAQLMGVATGEVQTDLRCIEKALQTGLISPWCAVNWGDDKSAPTRSYVFPDLDYNQTKADFAARNSAFLDDMAKYKAAGFVLNQEFVNRIADEHGYQPPRSPLRLLRRTTARPQILLPPRPPPSTAATLSGLRCWGATRCTAACAATAPTMAARPSRVSRLRLASSMTPCTRASRALGESPLSSGTHVVNWSSSADSAAPSTCETRPAS
jgi:hypothetical protein